MRTTGEGLLRDKSTEPLNKLIRTKQKALRPPKSLTSLSLRRSRSSSLTSSRILASKTPSLQNRMQLRTRRQTLMTSKYLQRSISWTTKTITSSDQLRPPLLKTLSPEGKTKRCSLLSESRERATNIREKRLRRSTSPRLKMRSQVCAQWCKRCDPPTEMHHRRLMRCPIRSSTKS